MNGSPVGKCFDANRATKKDVTLAVIVAAAQNAASG
jgi:hypothetical protein